MYSNSDQGSGTSRRARATVGVPVSLRLRRRVKIRPPNPPVNATAATIVLFVVVVFFVIRGRLGRKRKVFWISAEGHVPVTCNRLVVLEGFILLFLRLRQRVLNFPATSTRIGHPEG